MALATPALPDAQTVAAAIKAWAAADPGFASVLAAGKPPVLAFTRLSLELLHKNRAADAIDVLRSALALTPGNAVLWTNYGAVLNQENRPGEAAACLEHSLALSRPQPNTWLLLGMVRKKLGDPFGAEAAYRAALELEPGSLVAWQFLGLLKQEQRDYAAAMECLTVCAQAGGADAALLANLGKLCFQLGKFAEACNAYVRAAALDPANAHFRRMARRSSFLRAMLHGEAMETAIAAFQKSFLPQDKYTDQELAGMFNSAFSLLSGFGHVEAATRVGRKQLELWPANPSVTYLLKAVSGDAGVDRSPPEYVVEHFDAFAEGFDEQLVEALGYDIPEKICSAVNKLTPAGQLYDTLDAGCGTGLCGPLLRPLSRRLSGVDLSPKMLEQAQRRGIYDALACEELTAFLRNSTAQFDLVVAADVMIYFGDLAPIFSGAAAALRTGGLFVFSTELWMGAGYRIQPSGRFAQSPTYVRSLAAAEFEELAYTETTIRLDAKGRLPGNIFVLRRR